MQSTTVNLNSSTLIDPLASYILQKLYKYKKPLNTHQASNSRISFELTKHLIWIQQWPSLFRLHTFSHLSCLIVQRMEKTMTRIFLTICPRILCFSWKTPYFFSAVFPLLYIKALNTKPVPTVNCYNNVSGYISSRLRLCQNCLNFNSQNTFSVHYCLGNDFISGTSGSMYLNASNRSKIKKWGYWYPNCTYYWSIKPQLSDTVFAKFEAFQYFCNECMIRVNVSVHEQNMSVGFNFS